MTVRVRVAHRSERKRHSFRDENSDGGRDSLRALVAEAGWRLRTKHERATILRRHLEDDENALPIAVPGNLPRAECERCVRGAGDTRPSRCGELLREERFELSGRLRRVRDGIGLLTRPAE